MSKFICLVTLFFSNSLFAKVIFVSDLNGKKDGIVAHIDAGNLRLIEGRLEFANRGDKFVFGGNLSGQGTDSIKVRQWLMDLKRREPGNVNLIMGNAELNKLSALRDIRRYEKLSDSGYVEWLKNQVRAENKISLPKNLNAQQQKILQGQNSELRRVTYWHQKQGISRDLKNYQAEVKELTGKEPTPTQAASDFMQSIKPGGDLFRFLQMGQPVAVLQNNLFIRSGVNFTPGSTKNLPDVRTWAAGVNLTYKRDMEAIARGKDINISYDTNLKPLTKETYQYLRDNGISTEVVGHPPTDRPTPLLRGGLLTFRPDGSGNAVAVQDDGGITVAGKSLSGRDYQYSVSPRSHGVNGVNDAKGLIGKFANDYSIVGQDESGNYVLKKYYEGYQLDVKTVSAKELGQNYQIRSQVGDANYRRVLAKKLETKKVPVLGPQDLFDGRIGEKAPLVITGSVENASQQQSTRKALQKLADTLDPEKVVIVTDGMDEGVAKIANEVFRRKNFATVGFVKEGTAKEKINHDLSGIVLAGPGKENPLELGLNYAKDREGSIIFVGAEGIKNIEKANQAGVSHQVFVQGATADNDLISATTRARPEWVRGSRKALMEELSKQIKNKKINLVGYQDLLEKSKDYKVTVLEGLSDLKYKDPEAVKDYVRALMKANGDKAMYVLDGTSAGIGEAYKWIPLIAKELDYKDIKTAGIFSEKSLKSEIAKQDYIVVEPEDRKVDRKVELAEAASGKVVVLSNSNNVAAKIQTAVEREVPVTLIADPKIEPVKPKGFVDGTEKFKEHPKSFGGLTVATSTEDVVRAAKKDFVASDGGQQIRMVSAVKEDVTPPVSGEAAESSTKTQLAPPPRGGAKGFHDASANREAPSASSEPRPNATVTAETPNPKASKPEEGGGAAKTDISKDAATRSDSPKMTKEAPPAATPTATTTTAADTKTEDKGEIKKVPESTPRTVAPEIVAKPISKGVGPTVAPSQTGGGSRRAATQTPTDIKPEPPPKPKSAPSTVDPKCIESVMNALIK